MPGHERTAATALRHWLICNLARFISSSQFSSSAKSRFATFRLHPLQPVSPAPSHRKPSMSVNAKNMHLVSSDPFAGGGHWYSRRPRKRISFWPAFPLKWGINPGDFPEDTVAFDGTEISSVKTVLAVVPQNRAYSSLPSTTFPGPNSIARRRYSLKNRKSLKRLFRTRPASPPCSR